MNTLFKRMTASLFACALAGTMMPAAAIAEAVDQTQQLNNVVAADEEAAPTDDSSTGDPGTGDPGTEDPGTEEPTVVSTDTVSKKVSGTTTTTTTVTAVGVSYKVKTKSTGKWTGKATSPKKASAGSSKASGVLVYKPYIKTKTVKKAKYKDVTTTTYSDGTSKVAEGKAKTKKVSTTKKTKKYTPKVKVLVAGSGWKTAGWNSSKTAKTYANSSAAVQAVKISSDSLKKAGYDIYYRVYTKPFGWLSWTKNGKAAGSTGQNLSIGKLQLKLVKKGGKAPADADGALGRYISKPSIGYALDMEGKGYTSTKKNKAVAGTASWDAEAQRLKATVKSSSISGGIEYKVRTGKSTWSDWSADGDDAGKDGKTAQAIKVRLTGDLAKYYDVYYTTYCSDRHWLGWAKNGQKAGTGKINYPLGAVRMAIVPKGGAKPGSTSGHYVTKSAGTGGQLTMLRKAQQYSSSRNYLILVNRNATKVAVFKGKKGNWDLVLYSDCCVGAPGTPTPKGQFTTSGSKLRSFGEEKGYSVWKATNIFAGYFFHSILYYAHTMSVMDGSMNQWCSHGCIRMPYENAKWIYDHIHGGTKVVIY